MGYQLRRIVLRNPRTSVSSLWKAGVTSKFGPCIRDTGRRCTYSQNYVFDCLGDHPIVLVLSRKFVRDLMYATTPGNGLLPSVIIPLHLGVGHTATPLHRLYRSILFLSPTIHQLARAQNIQSPSCTKRAEWRINAIIVVSSMTTMAASGGNLRSRSSVERSGKCYGP